jgi:LemA protein
LTAAIVGIGALLLVLLAIALLYNRLVGARNRTRYAWSDIDALLARRAQAIPRLADVVRGSMAHEQGVFEAVATTRAGVAAVAGSGPSEARYAAEQRFGEAGAGLVAVVENYPQLRAQETVAELIAALKDVENDLRRARIVYNRTVQTYQDARLAFPSSLVAGAFGFGSIAYFGDAAA